MDNAEPHLLLDVRPLVEVDICRLPLSLSILFGDRSTTPISYFQSRWDYSPYIVARHSPGRLRGEEERTSPITPGENRPAEAADGG